MTLMNPITEQTFESENEEEYVESLIESYKDVKKKLYQLGQNESTLVGLFDGVAGEPYTLRGTLVINGTKQRVKVVRKLNAKYAKQRGEEHPLRTLLPKFDKLGGMIRLDYKESGSAIQALLDRLESGKLQLDDDEELAKALQAVRDVTAAKPSVVVEDRIDVGVGAS